MEAIPINLFEAIPKEIILKVSNNSIGADAVMEVVGLQSAFDFAYDFLRPGGTLSSVGAHTSATFGLAHTYVEKILPILESKALNLSSFITHRMTIHEGSEGKRIFDKKLDNCVKLVFDPM